MENIFLKWQFFNAVWFILKGVHFKRSERDRNFKHFATFSRNFLLQESFHANSTYKFMLETNFFPQEHTFNAKQTARVFISQKWITAKLLNNKQRQNNSVNNKATSSVYIRTFASSLYNTEPIRSRPDDSHCCATMNSTGGKLNLMRGKND